MTQSAPAPQGNIQANLVRASRFADGRTRDWTLFFFFRIMNEGEMAETLGRIGVFTTQNFAEPREAEKVKQSALSLIADFQSPSLVNAGLRDELAPETPGLMPTGHFRNWLRALVSSDADGLRRDAEELLGALSAAQAQGDGVAARDADAEASELLGLMAEHAHATLTPGLWGEKMGFVYGPARDAGLKALEGGLLEVVKYEILRQGAPAFLSEPPTIRDEVSANLPPKGLDAAFDPAPINIAFSWNGLRALGLDQSTLDSFPEPFRDGMALRAERLHDKGVSSPNGWEGAFGLARTHGYFTGGFLVGDETRRVEEALWRRLRREVAAFNAPETHDGWDLRAHVGALFRPLGLEIVHIELGQDPYEIDEAGYACPRLPRVEHFGFRDGLSQPFADLALRDPGLGQGTPARNRTWSPVAPGELYLDLPDEDRQLARQPFNADLRRHGTYVVFRKLEQDVVGFRSFLSRQSGGDAASADRLAAEFVGRWRSGTPLVRSPDTDRAVGAGVEDELNDFLFAADDPRGAKCPLGAHIRRANPRDIGGRNEVRRHRLLRRSISYGGSLLPEASLGDGEPRGLLFVAMNARLDQQFEVIQADWLNSGEFLGQAGLGRCPLSGHHTGGPLDGFRRAGEVAPLTGIPNFVTLRGGEYFFAPGILALKAISVINPIETFKPDDPPFNGLSLGDARTRGLFDPERLLEYAGRFLAGEDTVEVDLPAAAGPSATAERMVFVGRYDDVVRVLSGGKNRRKLEFSVKPYHETCQRTLRGQDLLISTDANPAKSGSRERLRRVLDAAWDQLKQRRPDCKDLSPRVRASLAIALRRCGPTGRVDLVDDLAVPAAYDIVSHVYGVTGPDFLTELAVALPLGKQHLSELPPDWLKALKSAAPSDPGVKSLQVWSAMMLGDVIANLQSAGEAQPLSRQAGGEMLTHIDGLLSRALKNGPGATFTLVDAFIVNINSFVGKGKSYADRELYLRDAAVLLAEMTANTMAATPAAFGSVMQFLLAKDIPLSALAKMWGASTLTPTLADRVIYECDRLNPVLPVLQRMCEADATLDGGGATIRDGDRVAALLAAANLDGAKFKKPLQFLLDPKLRPINRYLMFGAPKGQKQYSDRQCWGRDIAMQILSTCLVAAASLKDLRGGAGKAAGPRKLLGLTIALPARFAPGHPSP